MPQDKSYFLIKESNEDSKTITLTDIPKGVYTGVSFMIGVDSARSASDISQRKGSLDVAGVKGRTITENRSNMAIAFLKNLTFCCKDKSQSERLLDFFERIS